MELRAEKNCPDCKTVKSSSQFHKNAARRDGLGSICKPCARARSKEWVARNPDKVSGYQSTYRSTDYGREATKTYRRAWTKTEAGRAHDKRNKHPAYHKARTLKMYGLSQADWDAMVRRQSGLCAICGCLPDASRHGKFHIDHNHETNVVRGLLCSHCNLALGGFKDSTVLLTAAVRYLECTNQTTQMAI